MKATSSTTARISSGSLRRTRFLRFAIAVHYIPSAGRRTIVTTLGKAGTLVLPQRRKPFSLPPGAAALPGTPRGNGATPLRLTADSTHGYTAQRVAVSVRKGVYPPMTTTSERPDLKVVGTRPIRHDGLDKVTGRAKYGADINMAGLLQGAILRSPHAHARIKKIDTSRAEKLAGVRAVVTAGDFELSNVGPGEGMYDPNTLVTNALARGKSALSWPRRGRRRRRESSHRAGSGEAHRRRL